MPRVLAAFTGFWHIHCARVRRDGCLATGAIPAGAFTMTPIKRALTVGASRASRLSCHAGKLKIPTRLWARYTHATV